MSESDGNRVRSGRHISAGALIAFGSLAIITLAVMVGTSPAYYLYDEPYYLAGPQLLAKGVAVREFLLAPLETPAGPLYAAIHWLCAPLTGLRAPAIRWPNLVLLCVGLGACAAVLIRWRLDRPWARAAMLLSVPIFWVSAGMALTEMPAFAFAALACAAAAWAMTVTDCWTRWALFALAGALLGIAVLGRQPYLPAAGGFVLIALVERRLRWPALLAALVTIALPLPVFLVWHGLVPPHVAFVGGGLSFQHGVIGYAYLSFLLCLLAPRFFERSWRYCIVAWVAAVAVILATGLNAGVTIASGVAARLPTPIATYFQSLAPSAFLGISACGIVAAIEHCLHHRQNRPVVLATLLMLITAATPAAVIHQFSSRYLMSAFPFVLFAVQPSFTPSRWAILRFLLGVMIGYLSLVPYLEAAPVVVGS